MIGEISLFITSSKENIMQDEIDENKLLEFALSLCEIIQIYKKNKINICIQIYNSLEEYKMIDLIFYDLFRILILNEVPIQDFDNFDQIVYLLNKNMKQFPKDKLLSIFNDFNKKLVTPILRESILSSKGKVNFISVLEAFLSYYEKIRHVYNLYFNIGWINKDKIFLDNIYEELKTFPLDESSIESLYNLLKPKEHLKVLNMMRILVFSKQLFEGFWLAFITAFRKYFIYVYSEYLKSNNALLFWEVTKEYENFLLTEENKSFFDLEINYINFLKVVSEVLNAKNTKSKIFSETFDLIIRLVREDLLDVVYSSLEMIEDFEKFEESYSFKIIERSLDEIFDKAKEIEIINQIMQRGKDKFVHYYKLQTLINNIKIGRNRVMNLVGVPSHCYHCYNFACKPNIVDSELINMFEDVKKVAKFPQNAKLIFQQGSIDFSFRKKSDVIIKVHPLQFVILKFISKEFKTCEIITQYLEISEDLLNFLVAKLVQSQLILTDNTTQYKLNHNFIKQINNTKYVDLYCNLFDFNRETPKISDKDISYLLDSYIMKYLKKTKKSNFQSIRTELMNVKIHNINEVEEKRVLDRLQYLIEKTLIKKAGMDLYVYC